MCFWKQDQDQAALWEDSCDGGGLAESGPRRFRGVSESERAEPGGAARILWFSLGTCRSELSMGCGHFRPAGRDTVKVIKAKGPSYLASQDVTPFRQLAVSERFMRHSLGPPK